MKHIHFVGIGGIGMSGIARVLLEMGYKVTGSDLKESRILKKLETLGAKCYIGHRAENIGDADTVVVSSAISPNNPEIVEAQAKNVRILQRAEMLGHLMKNRVAIAIAGTHGKTTTTSMIATIFEYSGLDSTVVIGGELNDIGSNAKLGSDPYFVAEADESDASFLYLWPFMAVVTNIDSDVNLNVMPYVAYNFDYEKTMEKIIQNFEEFINRVPSDGSVVLCADNENVRKILPRIYRKRQTFGFSRDADYRADQVKLSMFCSSSIIQYKGKVIGELKLRVPGRHNILNALAATVIGFEVGLNFKEIKSALYLFEGVQRRFQMLGEVSGILVVDDYAHNPSKIKAALHGARTGWNKRVIAVFQPHRYTRTMFLFEEFTEAFYDADILIVTDIYSAGECPIVGVKGENLANMIKKKAKNLEVLYIPRSEDVLSYLHKISVSGDLVITLGAGDISKVAYKFCKELKKRELNYAATG